MMKLPLVTIVFILLGGVTFAQEVPDIPEPRKVAKDSATIALEATNSQVFVEQTAGFPGGNVAFINFITNKTNTPELVTFFGFKGRIVVGFTVETSGRLKDIKAFSESGTGFEENILAAVITSPRWKPAIQNGYVVEQKFTIPIKFDIIRDQISMDELKKSSYKFTFLIKAKSYSIDEAEPILGKTFNSEKVDYIQSFLQQPEENRKNKKYLIQIKD